jgi:hypothetical protein
MAEPGGGEVRVHSVAPSASHRVATFQRLATRLSGLPLVLRDGPDEKGKFWQWTESGFCPGVSGAVDLDRCPG